MTRFSLPARTTSRSRTLRRVAPWVAGWLALQGVVLLAGRWAARRKDEGDESTAGIRRVRALDQVSLRPYHPELSRVRVDLLLAGGQLDLTGLRRVPGGVDVTVHALWGGMAVTVPEDWRIWISSSGVGGVGADPALRRTDDEMFADLRVHARLLFGGLGLEAGAPAVGHAA